MWIQDENCWEYNFWNFVRIGCDVTDPWGKLLKVRFVLTETNQERRWIKFPVFLSYPGLSGLELQGHLPTRCFIPHISEDWKVKTKVSIGLLYLQRPTREIAASSTLCILAFLYLLSCFPISASIIVCVLASLHHFMVALPFLRASVVLGILLHPKDSFI